MPPITLTANELNSLATFSQKLAPQNAHLLESIPAYATQAALMYQKFQCGACHTVNGVGQKLGPVLNGVSERRNREWLQDHFVNPQKVSPGTTMPPYKFGPKDMDSMTTWLLGLPPAGNPSEVAPTNSAAAL